MINIFKNFFNSKPVVQRSKYFPAKFYTGRMVTIDDGIGLFIKNSVIIIPDTPLFVKNITSWSIEDDDFESIKFENVNFYLLYDRVNDVFYGMEDLNTQEDTGDIQNSVIFMNINGTEYEYGNWTDIFDITENNTLLRIYNRVISKEADEYLFVTVNSNGKQTNTIGIVIQIDMIS